MTESAEIKIRAFAFASENRPYAFLQLFAILAKNLFRVTLPDMSKQAMICSEFVARAFLEGGIKLCDPAPELTTPWDIAKSDKIFLVKGWE